MIPVHEVKMNIILNIYTLFAIFIRVIFNSIDELYPNAYIFTTALGYSAFWRNKS